MTTGTSVPIGCLFLMYLGTLSRPVAEQVSFFEEGNQLYLSGDFAGALDRYLEIIDQGYGSASLFYNVGNTYFKLGDVGRSVLYYERALRLDPRDADIRANLELVRSLTTDDIAPLPTFWVVRVWRWWVQLIQPTWLAGAVSASYIIVIVGLIMHLLAKNASAVLGRRIASVAAVLLVVFGINLATRWLSLGQPDEAVILADEVLVQSAPSDDRSLQVFTIHTGTKVRVDQLSGDWAEIVLEDGKVGWVKREVFEMI